MPDKRITINIQSDGTIQLDGMVGANPSESWAQVQNRIARCKIWNLEPDVTVLAPESLLSGKLADVTMSLPSLGVDTYCLGFTDDNTGKVLYLEKVGTLWASNERL